MTNIEVTPELKASASDISGKASSDHDKTDRHRNLKSCWQLFCGRGWSCICSDNPI